MDDRLDREHHSHFGSDRLGDRIGDFYHAYYSWDGERVRWPHVGHAHPGSLRKTDEVMNA